MNIWAILTEATCATPCWEAKEEICRCSCGGRNHGCMRTPSGVQPQRTAKIDGVRYHLEATAPDDRHDSARRELFESADRLNGKKFHSYSCNVRNAPARIRNASKDQLAKWPELASYRTRIEEIKAAGNYCAIDIMRAWPVLLWVRDEEKQEPLPAVAPITCAGSPEINVPFTLESSLLPTLVMSQGKLF